MKQQITIALILLLIISISPFAFSATSTGKFQIGNEAPYITVFAVQDSAIHWDSSALDTHDITPSFRWQVNDVNPDTLSSTICIGSTSGACDILAETSAGTSYSSGDTATYDYTGLAINFNQLLDCSASACSKTLYVTIKLNDGQGGSDLKTYSVVFLNSVPTTPSALTPTTTHDQTPDLSWTATDLDDGTENKWPADVLIYHIQVGALAFGDEDYVIDPAASTSSITSTDYTASIPWLGSIIGTQSINTVYVRIWTTDNLGIDSANYDTTLDLIDNIPDPSDPSTIVTLSDKPLEPRTCNLAYEISGNPSPCWIDPEDGNYQSVNIYVSFDDTDDGDCPTDTVQVTLAHPDKNYVYTLDYDSTLGTTCTFKKEISVGDSQGIEFFRSPLADPVADPDFDMFVSITSLGGSLSPATFGWDYSLSRAISYALEIDLGDPLACGGNDIQLGSWNPGTCPAQMINWGNKVLTLDWEASDPSSLLAPQDCSGHTTTCWDLSTTDDFEVDDDTNQADDTGNLVAVNIPEEPLPGNGNQFNPIGGLQVCDVMTCDTGINEFLDTYFHILPPAGLSPGEYTTTITITLN